MSDYSKDLNELFGILEHFPETIRQQCAWAMLGHYQTGLSADILARCTTQQEAERLNNLYLNHSFQDAQIRFNRYGENGPFWTIVEKPIASKWVLPESITYLYLSE
jgi:hypothetical protein